MRSSIFSSLTVVSDVQPEAMVENEQRFRVRDEEPSLYVRHECDDLREAISWLSPLTLGRAFKHLILHGRNNSVCAFSNYASGSAAGLVIAACSRLKCDRLSIIKEYPLDIYQRHNVTAAFDMFRELMPQVFFVIDYRRYQQDCSVRRSIRLTDCPGMELNYTTGGGEWLPFEKEEDYLCLEKGIAVDDSVVARFVADFGWPMPRSAEFVDFITKIEMYEFPPSASSKPLPNAAQAELLALPEEWGL